MPNIRAVDDQDRSAELEWELDAMILKSIVYFNHHGHTTGDILAALHSVCEARRLRHIDEERIDRQTEDTDSI